MKYIYLLTAPNGKKYVGKSTLTVEKKMKIYEDSIKYNKSTKRLILNAIKKYGWHNFTFDILEQNENWDTYTINEKEKFYIKKMNTYYTYGKGYNMTKGGDGVDSESASVRTKNQHKQMSDEKKQQRSINCSKGQKERYSNSKDTIETRQKKSKAHQGNYLIESPDGKKWEITNGLKEFAEEYGDQLGITYWSLFNAYRKTYSKEKTTKKRKNINNWKVTRLDR